MSHALRRFDWDELAQRVRADPSISLREHAKYFRVSHEAIRRTLEIMGMRTGLQRGERKFDWDELARRAQDNPDTPTVEHAEYFGVTGWTIRNALKQMGLEPPGQQRKFDWDELAQRVQNNPDIPTTEHAEYFAVSPGSIRNALLNMGLEPAGQQKKFNRDELARRVKQNPEMPIAEHARHFKASRGTVAKALKRMEREA